MLLRVMDCLSSMLFAPLVVRVAVGARLGVVIYKRGGKVHYQNRKSDRVRVVATNSDGIDQHADQSAIDQSPANGDGRSDGVGYDEKGTEHGCAAEQVE